MILGEEVADYIQLDENQITQTVAALLKYVKLKSSSSFLDDGQTIILQLCFKKIPEIKNKVIKIHLPHPLIKETSDVCLFVKDLNRKERDYTPTVEHFKELLKEAGIKNLPQIIPLKSLKLEYQPFEAKLNLSNMYDVYLADDRIVRLLPDFLGKHFYSRKRHPIQINLTAKDLKKEYEKVIAISQCIIGGRGSTSSVAVAHTSMKESSIISNIKEAVRKLVEVIPGGAVNIRNLHIKTVDSLALPIYVSAGDADEVVFPAKVYKRTEDDDDDSGDEVVGIEGKVRVTKSGDIIILGQNGKKRKLEDITECEKEVLDTDAGDSDDGEEDDDDEEEELVNQSVKKQKKNVKMVKSPENKIVKKDNEKKSSLKKKPSSTVKEKGQVILNDKNTQNTDTDIPPPKKKKLNTEEKPASEIKNKMSKASLKKKILNAGEIPQNEKKNASKASVQKILNTDEIPNSENKKKKASKASLKKKKLNIDEMSKSENKKKKASQPSLKMTKINIIEQSEIDAKNRKESNKALKQRSPLAKRGRKTKVIKNK